MVSTLSVVVSTVILIVTTKLTPLDGLAVGLIGIAFTLSQILLATRMDLDGAILSAGEDARERAAQKTVAKVVVIGLILATLAGLSSLASAMLAGGGVFLAGEALAYVLPSSVALLYLLFSLFYYTNKINLSFNSLIA
jgi:hypothetical protein